MIEITPETNDFIKEHYRDDVRTLALQSARYPSVDIPVAITQIAGRQIAAEKVPSWSQVDEIRYPRHLSMEQCSSEITARYKARLVQGESFADLTGGFGIDCAFLAAKFETVTYVERQEELCGLAIHNFRTLGLSHIQVRNGDGVDFLRQMPPVDCIFIDPARRNEHGRKIVAIGDCEPDVAALEELLLEKARRVMIKLSPMLDLAQALKELKHTQEVHIVSVNNECKELLLILAWEESVEIPIHCVNLATRGRQHYIFTRSEEREAICTYANEMGKYLYEPNASILKAGAFKLLTSIYPMHKLHTNSHLYTSDEVVENFPGRIFHVTGHCTFNKKEIKEALGDMKQANITTRNFPVPVAELRKRLKLNDGGDVYLFATTFGNDKKILIRCQKVPTPVATL